MEMISWTDSVRNEVLRGVKVDRDIYIQLKRRITGFVTYFIGTSI
jgi:hypothetical protein